MAEETNQSLEDQNVQVEEGQTISDEAIEQAVEGAEKELDNAKK